MSSPPNTLLIPVGGGPGIGMEPGQCPCLDNTCTWCQLPTGRTSCNQIRECDPYTGAVHYQYSAGSVTYPNANIWTISPDSGKAVWLGPTGTPATPPSYATPASNILTAPINPSTGQAQVTPTIAPSPGLQYSPSAGWIPLASAPPETHPGAPGNPPPVTPKTASTVNPVSVGGGTSGSGGGPVGGTTVAPGPGVLGMTNCTFCQQVAQNPIMLLVILAAVYFLLVK